MSTEAEEIQKNKRKRKKSFMKNARKYGKKGCYGRGYEMEPETYNYFIKIMETFREGFESDEEKHIFINNVFEQTEGNETNYCCNQIGCRAIEMLLPHASDKVLIRFTDAFGANLRPFCSDRYASFVLQSLIKTTCHKTATSNDNSGKLKEFSIKISRFLLNNLEDFVWDTNGNHIIRTCLSALVQLPENDNKSNKTIIKEETIIPNDFIEIVTEYGERMLSWPQFNELCFSENTSGLLQILLKSLKQIDKKLVKKYIQKILDINFAETNSKSTDEILANKPFAMLFETAIAVSGPKMISEIHSRCFSGRIAKLSLNKNSNFAVQKLMLRCKEKSDFENIFDELKDHFKEIINIGHTGVLLALAQTCRRLSTRQGMFVQHVMESLDCIEPEEKQINLVRCLSRFAPIDQANGDKLSLHGTLILQEILEFNKPIKVVNSLLEMNLDELKNLCTHSMGSHIIDSFFKSTFVGAKNKERFTRRIRGTYMELVSSKYGSRCFETLWPTCDIKNKLSIMDELSYKDGSWSNSIHGKIIADKINLALYKKNKEQWKNVWNDKKSII